MALSRRDRDEGGDGRRDRRTGEKWRNGETPLEIGSPIPQAGEANRARTVSSRALSAVGGRSHTAGGRHHFRCSPGGGGPVHAGPAHTSAPAAAAPPGVGPGGPVHPRLPRNVPSEIAKDLARLPPRLPGLELSLWTVHSATRFRLPYALLLYRVVFSLSGPRILCCSQGGIRGLPPGRHLLFNVIPFSAPSAIAKDVGPVRDTVLSAWGVDVSGKVRSPSPAWIADIERHAILAPLESTHGNKTRAAALLGITRTKLHTRLKGFGITAEPAV